MSSWRSDSGESVGYHGTHWWRFVIALYCNVLYFYNVL